MSNMLHMCMYITVLLASKSEKHGHTHLLGGRNSNNVLYTHKWGRKNYNVLGIHILTYISSISTEEKKQHFYILTMNGIETKVMSMSECCLHPRIISNLHGISFTITICYLPALCRISQLSFHVKHGFQLFK